jgi:hypothetical protein
MSARSSGLVIAALVVGLGCGFVFDGRSLPSCRVSRRGGAIAGNPQILKRRGVARTTIGIGSAPLILEVLQRLWRATPAIV